MLPALSRYPTPARYLHKACSYSQSNTHNMLCYELSAHACRIPRQSSLFSLDLFTTHNEQKSLPGWETHGWPVHDKGQQGFIPLLPSSYLRFLPSSHSPPTLYSSCCSLRQPTMLADSLRTTHSAYHIQAS